MINQYNISIFLLSIFLSTLLISCNDDKPIILSEPTDSLKEFKFNKIALKQVGSEVSNILSIWSVYYDLEERMLALPNDNLENIRVKTSQVLHLADSLVKTVPTIIDETSIRARLDVLNVNLGMLNQFAHANYVDSLKLVESYHGSIIAINSLLEQVEEKLIKDRILSYEDDNLHIEIQKQYKDSISLDR